MREGFIEEMAHEPSLIRRAGNKWVKSPGKDLLASGNGNNRPLCVAYERKEGQAEMTWKGGQKTIKEGFGWL